MGFLDDFKWTWGRPYEPDTISDSLGIHSPTVDIKFTNSPWERGGKGEESQIFETPWAKARPDSFFR